MSDFIDEIYQARRDFEKMKKKIAAKKLQLKQLKVKVSMAEKEFENDRDYNIPKKHINRIVHNLTGDFAPGDKAYVIETRTNRIKCKFCNEDGKVVAKIGNETYSIVCPICNGFKFLDVKDTPVIEEKTVSSVRVKLCFDKYGVHIWNTDTIFLDNSDFSTNIQKIFHSRQEAEEAISRMK